MKTSKLLYVFGAIVIIMVALLIARKEYALSDKQMLSYHWKAYHNCSLKNSYGIKKDELAKIGKQWKVSYRWYDNSVFLDVSDDPKFGECVYISK